MSKIFGKATASETKLNSNLYRSEKILYQKNLIKNLIKNMKKF